ncbi:hypothetical protein N802_16050 [Knoellia sinensis KCTC 19936]|uniref:Uncharacterized protein n=1 Tax=Knoellia sinensis KCTC 19936 TaxID=1385520 RepID=A0A0A0J811_9MICO|nr:DUF6069 family protein [Knoellia sinensis]KGN32899.1 hypothetical protein N802_16050 [Knoellia sinensis KCTC 19936]
MSASTSTSTSTELSNSQAVTSTHAVPRARNVALATAGIAAIVNLIVYAVARVAGAEFSVLTPMGSEPQAVGALSVAFMSVVAGLLGAALLRGTKRWAPTSWKAIAALGLIVGIVTMPLFAEASAGTKVALSAMHLISGATFFVSTRRELRG